MSLPDWMMERLAHPEEGVREWLVANQERLTEQGGPFVGFGFSCIRCGRWCGTAACYGPPERERADVGHSRGHWCDVPYFRPRSVHHPLGPTEAQRVAAVTPALFDAPAVVSGPVRDDERPEGREPVETSLDHPSLF